VHGTELTQKKEYSFERKNNKKQINQSLNASTPPPSLTDIDGLASNVSLFLVIHVKVSIVLSIMSEVLGFKWLQGLRMHACKDRKIPNC
jgi:hypothetical protein